MVHRYKSVMQMLNLKLGTYLSYAHCDLHALVLYVILYFILSGWKFE
jgi:hypothetical protein